jgi:hypothetical protein
MCIYIYNDDGDDDYDDYDEEFLGILVKVQRYNICMYIM